MHRKKSGAYILKPHQLADARHKTLADTLQHSGAAAHVPPALAPGVLVQLASRVPRIFRFVVHPVTRQLGLGHGTFVIQDDPPVVCAHHPQHGVTLWSSTPDELRAYVRELLPPPPGGRRRRPRRWPPPPPPPGGGRDMDGAARVGAARGRVGGARRAGGGPRRAAGGAAGDPRVSGVAHGWRARGRGGRGVDGGAPPAARRVRARGGVRVGGGARGARSRYLGRSRDMASLSIALCGYFR